MAILKSVGTSKAPVSKGIDYITQEVKTKDNLIATHNCMVETAKIEMMMNKNIHNKEQGVQYYHYVVSFNPEDDLTPERANEIGTEYMKNIEKWKDHKVVMATHTDKDHIHNHYIIDSVNMESGLKYQRSPKELEQMKEQLKEISKKYDLTIPEKSNERGNLTQDYDKFRAIDKAIEGNYKSYVLDTYYALKSSVIDAKSKDEFIGKMNEKGYLVTWKDTRKHITFENADGKKVRLANLEKTFNDKILSKKSLENKFIKNIEREERKVELKARTSEIQSKETEIIDRIDSLDENKTIVEQKIRDYNIDARNYNAEIKKSSFLNKVLKATISPEKKALDKLENEIKDKGYSKKYINELSNKIKDNRNKLIEVSTEIRSNKNRISLIENTEHKEKTTIKLPKREKEKKKEHQKSNVLHDPRKKSDMVVPNKKKDSEIKRKSLDELLKDVEHKIKDEKERQKNTKNIGKSKGYER